MAALAATRRPVLRGAVFDMDGTLTKPNLDFKEMYQRCGVELTEDLLSAIASMPAERQAAAKAVIAEMEAEGRRTLELFPGAAECCRWLQAHGIPLALVTRNTHTTVDHFHATLWEPAGVRPFAPAISRDDESVPPKPDPAALHKIAEGWGVAPSELLMVGDSVSNDVGFGKAAGTWTALVDSGRARLEGKDGGASFVVENLALLPRKLWLHFDIESASPVTPGAEKFEAPRPSSEAARAAERGDRASLSAAPAAELDAADESGNTPLIWAAESGHAACIELLLSKGANVNHKGFLGATAITRASRHGHIDALRVLLDHPKADMNAGNKKLQTPLHFAAFKHQRAAVELLLERGANTLVLDRKGRTPAEDTSDEAIKQRLLHVRAQQMATPSLWQP